MHVSKEARVSTNPVDVAASRFKAICARLEKLPESSRPSPADVRNGRNYMKELKRKGRLFELSDKVQKFLN